MALFVNPALAERPVIVVLGDSLSAGYGIDRGEGWVALLQRRLAEQGLAYRVVNSSISGDTTRGGLERLPRTIETHRPALLIIELGANDGLRGFPVSETRSNLREMITLAQREGVRVLVLGMRIPANYGRRYTERFAGVFPEVAHEAGVPLVPFFLERVAQHPELMQDDTIHPNEAAQPYLLETVWAALSPLL